MVFLSDSAKPIVGELLLTTTVVALHCYWFWYWAVGWSYRSVTVDLSSKQYALET
jgi:hypothetical protein